MVNYSCPRCGFNTNIKTKYINHLRRKFICKNKISGNNLLNEYKKYNINDIDCIQISTRCHKNISKMSNNINEPELYDFVCACLNKLCHL